MVNKKKQNFFLTLPKKELQTLCRKYGQPSYKPKPYLAEALTDLLPENIELRCLYRKCADTSCSRSTERNDSSLDLNVLPRISGNKYLGAPGIGRKENMSSTSRSPADNALLESVRSVDISSPSFEFHVRSEEGINLYIDLNSTPSEWAESMKKNICVAESCTKSQRFHLDLERFRESSSHLKGSSPATVNETNDKHSLSGTAPRSEINEDSSKDFDNLDITDGSMMSCIGVSHKTDMGYAKHIEEDRVFILPKITSCEENQIPVSASTDEPKIDYVGDSVSNSLSEGAISFLTSEQPVKVITEECASSPVRYNCNPSHVGSTMRGCSFFAAREKNLPEAAAFQKDKGSPCKTDETGLVDHICNMESEQGESAHSSGIDHGTEGNQLLISSEKEERSTTASGMEMSGCTQFEKCHERESSVTDDFDSSDDLQKKQNADGIEGSCSDPEGRNLSRSNHLAGEVLPRRSMRLVSK